MVSFEKIDSAHSLGVDVDKKFEDKKRRLELSVRSALEDAESSKSSPVEALRRIIMILKENSEVMTFDLNGKYLFEGDGEIMFKFAINTDKGRAEFNIQKLGSKDHYTVLPADWPNTRSLGGELLEEAHKQEYGK